MLAVSYGGTLDLKGHKGAVYEGWEADMDPTYSGMSWMRLDDGTHVPNDMVPKSMPEVLFLERDPRDKWQAGDEIVVTTTDYLPGHSEKLRIKKVAPFADGADVEFEPVDSPPAKARVGGTMARAMGVRRRRQGCHGTIEACRVACSKDHRPEFLDERRRNARSCGAALAQHPDHVSR